MKRERTAARGFVKGIVISGDEGVTKPDPAIYRTLLERYGVAAEDAVFIDDRAENVQAAEMLGFRGVHLAPGVDLRGRLRGLGLPVAAQRAATA